MRTEIQTVDGWTISFDTMRERFTAQKDSDPDRRLESNSYGTLTENISKAVKRDKTRKAKKNGYLKVFDVDSDGDYSEYEITSIADDGQFWIKDKDGNRSKVWAASYRNLLQSNDESKQIVKKIKELAKKKQSLQTEINETIKQNKDKMLDSAKIEKLLYDKE